MSDQIQNVQGRASIQAVNERLSGGIDASELNDLKSMAATGDISLMDIRGAIGDIADPSTTEGLSPALAQDVTDTLYAMLGVAQKGALNRSEAVAGPIDKANHFLQVIKDKLGIGDD